MPLSHRNSAFIRVSTVETILLNPANFKSAVLASGTIPLVIAGVRDIFSAPAGVYRDGGLFQYHLNQQYCPREGEFTLLFHHQTKLVPGWLDKKLHKRRTPDALLESVIMVFPHDEFVEALPGGKVPDRNDLALMMNEPDKRKRRWRKTVEISAGLGEDFLELVNSGKIKDMAEKL